MKISARGLMIAALAISLSSNLFLCRQVSAQTPMPAGVKTITLGLVSEVNQREIQEYFRAFVDYVARKLTSGPAIEGKVVVAPTVVELAKLLDQRAVDFYMESPYPTYIVNGVHNAGKLILRRWKSGTAEYRSLIFTKKGGGVSRMQDLRGKMIAFEDRESTSGYFLPKFFLQRNNLQLAEKPRAGASVAPAEVGYVFAKSQDRLVEMVLSGQVAAATFSDDDYGMLKGNIKTDLEIVAQTELLPRHLVSVRKALAPALTERLALVLISMSDDDQGRKIMHNTDNTTKFDPLPGGEEIMRRRLLETFYSPQRK